MSARIMIFQQTEIPVLTDVLKAGITGASIGYVQQIINYRESSPADEQWKESGFNLEFGRIPEGVYDKLAAYSRTKLGGLSAWIGEEKLSIIPANMGEALAKKFKKTYEPAPIDRVADLPTRERKAGVKGTNHPTLVYPDDDATPEKRIQVGVRALLAWFDGLPRAEKVRWYDADMPVAFMILPGERCKVEPMTPLVEPGTMQIETVSGEQQSACAVVVKVQRNSTVGHAVNWWSNESQL
ncbi:hypothetical protein ACTXM3_09355 [Glutamicibacter arilaitensis]|uniref:hypothetical protein n=1 Tax=Glutamicibacter arilaitensis TaxID=256701 RepID=UPI003FD21A90